MFSRFISSLALASTLLTGFVPMYIVEKYTKRDRDGEFVHLFGVVAETPSNRAGANNAQNKFAASYGR